MSRTSIRAAQLAAAARTRERARIAREISRLEGRRNGGTSRGPGTADREYDLVEAFDYGRALRERDFSTDD